MIGVAVFLCLAASVATESIFMPYAINCDELEMCHMDNFAWCLVGEREPVIGHCDLQKRVCSGAKIDTSNSCFLPYVINCEYPRTCGRDMQPWCLQGEADAVLGHCAVQDAICDRNATVDTTDSCLFKLPYTISCEHPRTCISDMKAWCLENRSQAVYGHCALQDAICDENASVDFTESCLP